jgi:hypothetical protein
VPEVDLKPLHKALRRVCESSSSAKIAPELQIHEISLWSSSTVDLRFRKPFGTTPYLHNLYDIWVPCVRKIKNKKYIFFNPE